MYLQECKRKTCFPGIFNKTKCFVFAELFIFQENVTTLFSPAGFLQVIQSLNTVYLYLTHFIYSNFLPIIFRFPVHYSFQTRKNKR